jgi:hypothetical protein
VSEFVEDGVKPVLSHRQIAPWVERGSKAPRICWPFAAGVSWIPNNPPKGECHQIMLAPITAVVSWNVNTLTLENRPTA